MNSSSHLGTLATNSIEMEVTIDDTNNTPCVINRTTNSGCPYTINMPDPSLVEQDNNTPQQELEPAPLLDEHRLYIITTWHS
jgi:hypothetical protein